MSVEELQRDRERLKHALRKAEQKVEQAYEAAEGKMSQCNEALQATITRTEGQEKLVVQLLQEGKKKAEASEKSARKHAESLHDHLDTMTKRALAAEERLAQNEKEAARLTAKLAQASKQVRALETAASQATIQHDTTVSRIQQDLVTSRAEAKADKERGKLLVELIRETYAMAAGVISNAGALGDQLVNCCAELGKIANAVSEVKSGVYMAVEISKQGVRLVLERQDDKTKVRLLEGTADGTLKEMHECQAQELAPFLPGASPDQLRDEVRKNGDILIKRKAGGGQDQDATTQNMEQWHELYRQLAWSPTTTAVTEEEFIKLFIDHVSEARAKALCSQMTNLRVDVTSELNKIDDPLQCSYDVRASCEDSVDMWVQTCKEWKARISRLRTKVRDAVADESIVACPQTPPWMSEAYGTHDMAELLIPAVPPRSRCIRCHFRLRSNKIKQAFLRAAVARLDD